MNGPSRIPFLDLAALHAPIKEDILAAVGRVIDSGLYAGGPFVEDFEADFARYCGVNHCVGVGTGTDALWLALEAMGIGPGDEVITVSTTFIATVEAISRTGAKPVFVDIDPITYTMDPRKLERAATRRTKAIVPVHLYGRMADMDSILMFAADRNLKVVEDAAQAHGAEYRGRKAGSFGDAGCFSFYPGKNLGALGEAGAIVTNDADLANRLRMLRDHGQTRRGSHLMIGWNCRMDAIQAAVLKLKLPDLDRSNEKRRQHAARYTKALGGVPFLVLPASGSGHSHVHHLFVVQVPEREGFIERLARRGIGSAVHYPVPVHLQEAYAHLGYKPGTFPVSEYCADRFVSLPVRPDLTAAQIDEIAAAVIEAARSDMAA